MTNHVIFSFSRCGFTKARCHGFLAMWTSLWRSAHSMAIKHINNISMMPYIKLLNYFFFNYTRLKKYKEVRYQLLKHLLYQFLKYHYFMLILGCALVQFSRTPDKRNLDYVSTDLHYEWSAIVHFSIKMPSYHYDFSIIMIRNHHSPITIIMGIQILEKTNIVHKSGPICRE